MAVLRTRRKVLGRKKCVSSVPINNGRVIASDSRRIAQINRELRRKCEIQRQNDADASAIAATLYAGL